MRIFFISDDTAMESEIRTVAADFGLDWQVSIESPHEDSPKSSELPDLLLLDQAVLMDRWMALRERYPTAARIALVQRSPTTMVNHLIAGAHRVITKPLDVIELIDAVESLTGLRSLIAGDKWKQAIGQIDSLPPAPKIYLEMTQLLRDPQIAFSRISEVLGQDPALTARVLRLCNSVVYSSGREIVDLRSAVTRLGLQTLQQLVLASEVFGPGPHKSDLEREEIQARALRVSILAGRILGGPSASIASTAGLLTEVGQLVQLDLVGDAGNGEDGVPSYPAIGAFLLGLWGLPIPVVEAVAYQLAPRKSKGGGFWATGAVHVAVALVNGLPVDTGYLDQVGQLGKLDDWRRLAEDSDEQEPV